MTATIVSIVYQPLDQEYEDGRFDSFLRVPLETAVLVANHGIQGDRKAGHSVRRQLNLLSTSWLAARQVEGFRTEPGDFGEQLIVDGLAIEELPKGTRVQLGATAVIEITGPRTGCERLQAAQPQSIKAIRPRIGVLARVLQGGIIRRGDAVLVMVGTEAELAGR